MYTIYNQNYKTEQKICHQRHLDRTTTFSFRQFVVQLQTNHCILSLSSLAPINTITVPFFYQTRVILDAQHDLIASDILGQLESCCLLQLPGQSRASNSFYSQCRPPHRGWPASWWCSLTLKLLTRFRLDHSIFQFWQQGHWWLARHPISSAILNHKPYAACSYVIWHLIFFWRL